MASRLTRRSILGGIGMTVGTAALGRVAHAQAWPSKGIRILCGFPPGGYTDLLARACGEHLASQLGQSVVVENRTGAGGGLAALAVKLAPADGYTLMMTISTTMLVNRVMYRTLPYDADRDFVLISCLPGPRQPFVAHKSTGATNLKEFVAYARTHDVSVGCYAPGSVSHIVSAQINNHFGLNMRIVQYRGEAPMWQDMLNGTLQAACGTYTGGASVFELGAGRPIAMTTTKRLGKLPQVATFHEQGAAAKAFEVRGFAGLVGPTGIPQPIVEQLSALTVEANRSERVLKLFDIYGIDDGLVGHDEFRRIYAEEGPVWIDLVKQLNLIPE
jgi:tripartite-type tricarboxylate transporter receptor subunit TctC